MAKPSSDRDRVIFIAPPGTVKMYNRAAELLGVRRDTWIRSTLYTEARLVLEEHGVDTDGLPPPHLPRPPRLQPRMTIDDDEPT